MQTKDKKVCLIGVVETRPEPMEVKGDGVKVAWSIRTRDPEGRQDGGPRWMRIVASGALAERALRSITAGDAVQVAGCLRGRSWTDSSGRRRCLVEVQLECLLAEPATLKVRPVPAPTQAENAAGQTPSAALPGGIR